VSEPPTFDPFELFRSLVATRVQRMHERLMTDPASDWPGALFLDVPGKVIELSFHRVAGLDDVGKRRLATKVLPNRIRRQKAGRFCWLMPSWRENVEPPEECLCLVFADRNRRGMLLADVVRVRGRPPRLGPWQKGPGGEDPIEISGLFVDSLVAALEPDEPVRRAA
jgi:hypothetical protein